MSALRDAIKAAQQDVSASIIKTEPNEKSGWNMTWLRQNANTIMLAAALGSGAMAPAEAKQPNPANAHMAGASLLVGAQTDSFTLEMTDKVMAKAQKFNASQYKEVTKAIPSTVEIYKEASENLSKVSESDLKTPEGKVAAKTYLDSRNTLISELDMFAKQHAAGVHEKALTPEDVKVAADVANTLKELSIMPKMPTASQGTLMGKIKAIPEMTVLLANQTEAKVGEGVEAIKNSNQFQRLASRASGTMMPAVDAAAKKLKNSM